MNNDNKLYLSKTDKKISGVCGGIGEHFGIDSTYIRLAFVILFAYYRSGLMLYIFAALIIPSRPQGV